MGGGMAVHIVNVGNTWRKAASLTGATIGHNKCVVLSVLILVLLLIIILVSIFDRPKETVQI
jgi:hypothetical protein